MCDADYHHTEPTSRATGLVLLLATQNRPPCRRARSLASVGGGWVVQRCVTPHDHHRASSHRRSSLLSFLPPAAAPNTNVLAVACLAMHVTSVYGARGLRPPSHSSRPTTGVEDDALHERFACVSSVSAKHRTAQRDQGTRQTASHRRPASLSAPTPTSMNAHTVTPTRSTHAERQKDTHARTV